MGRGAGVTQCPVPGHALSPSLGSLNDAQAMKVHQEVNCLTDFLDEPRGARRDSKGEWSPLLPFDMRPDSLGESRMQT